MKCLCLSRGTAAKSCTPCWSKIMLHLGPVRLLPLINLNLKAVLLRNKSFWRIYCLCVDHSSVYLIVTFPWEAQAEQASAIILQ